MDCDPMESEKWKVESAGRLIACLNNGKQTNKTCASTVYRLSITNACILRIWFDICAHYAHAPHMKCLLLKVTSFNENMPDGTSILLDEASSPSLVNCVRVHICALYLSLYSLCRGK